MKLIFLLLFVIVPLNLCSTNYKVLGELDKYSNESFYPNISGQYCAYYLRVDDIPDGSSLYFRISLSSGSFENGNMHYIFYNTPLSRDDGISLSNQISQDFYSNSTKAYYYIIPKLSGYLYLYISPPIPIKYDSKSYVKIINTFGPTYFVLGELSKYDYETFNPTLKGKYGIYRINMDDFSKNSEIYFKTTLTSGVFAYGYMYYGSSNTKWLDGQEITLSTAVSYYSNVTDKEYFFSIQKTSFKFLYVAPPPPYGHDSQSTITVYNTYQPYDIIYTVLGELLKSGQQAFTPTEDRRYSVYYIELDNFPKDSKLKFKVDITNGNFEHEYIFYGYLNEKIDTGKTIYLRASVKSDSSGSFTLSTTSYKYLYIAPPPPYSYSAQSTITVSNIFQQSYKLLGELSKFSQQSFYPYKKGDYCGYYIQMANFKKEEKLYFNVTLSSPGSFKEKCMYYGGNNNKYSTQITLQSCVPYSSYRGNTYSFVIPKVSYNYLYIGLPRPYNYNSKTKITVSNLYSKDKIYYSVLGELPRSGQKTFSPKEEGKYCTYYIKLDNFPKNCKLKFKADITYGSFEHNYMFYDYFDKEYNNDANITLSNNVQIDSQSTFNIPTASYKYLYIAPPPSNDYKAQTKITVSDVYVQYYVLLGELLKFSQQTFSLNDKGEHCAYFVYLPDFPKETELYFNLTLTSGNLKDECLYYGGSNDRFLVGKKITLPNNVSYSNYSDKTYTFIVPKVKYNYLYFGPSRPIKYENKAKITISNLYRTYKISYNVIGGLTKSGQQTFSPKDKGIYCTYFIKLDDFEKDSILNFKAVITDGSFEHENMFYDYFDKEYDKDTEISLSKNVKIDTSDFFNIPIYSYKYLYIAPPPPNKYNDQTRINVSNYFVQYYRLLDQISKYNEKFFTLAEKREYCAYYIDTDYFPNDTELYFNLTITSGNFKDEILNYGTNDIEFGVGKKITLPINITYSNKSDGSYIFTIQKNSDRFLYFGPSRPYNYSSQSRIIISNLYRPYKIEYKVLGELTKSGQETFNPYVEGKYCAYYIILDEFPTKIKDLKFKVELSYGSFEHDNMFYEYSNEELNNETTISFSKSVMLDSSGNFTIPTASYKYLYIAPPPPNELYSQSRITVYNIYTQYYQLLGELPKYSEKTFSPKDKGDYCAYYIDLFDFPKDSYLYFNVTLTSGNIKNGLMYYEFSVNKFNDGDEISLPNNVTFTNYSEGSYSFIVPKSNYKYLYIAPSRPINYDTKPTITVYSTYDPNSIAYKVLGEIQKYSNETFNPHEKGKYCTYYIDTDDFPTDDELYFQVELSHGTFEHKNMYYEGFKTKFNTDKKIALSDFVSSKSSSKIDDEYTYNFTIPKSSHKYLYIAVPPSTNNIETTSITIYSINNKTYTVLGELLKLKYETFNPNEKGKSCVLYLKTDDFSNGTDIYFKVTLTNGNFKHGYMNYGSFDEPYDNGTEITLPEYVIHYNYSITPFTSSSSFSSTTYKEITYYFSIRKPSNKYLYIAPPSPSSYDSESRITVNNIEDPNKKDDSKGSDTSGSSKSNGLAIGLGVGIPCFVILVVVIVIVVYKKKNRGIKSSEVENSYNEPMHLTANHY